MKMLTAKELVQKITGPIRAVGSSHVDTERLVNLGEFIDVVDELLESLYDAATVRDSGEASIVTAKKRAREFLIETSKRFTAEAFE